MSWKKYFTIANTSGQVSPISGNTNRGSAYNQAQPDFAFRNYQSSLPEVYTGHPNRIDRYNQFESMDSDSEINACLDIIAEFSTRTNPSNNTPFAVDYKEDPTDHEIEIIKKQLQQWTKLNKLDQRMFKLFRNTIKYGDQVMVRDPETFELYWVDMSHVGRVIVNESKGKEPEQYVIRDINPNFKNLTVAAKTTNDYPANSPAASAQSPLYNNNNNNFQTGNNRFQPGVNESVIDAKHVMHISLTEGLDFGWPFGQSILENVFKVFKQKELLEDAILIYRVQRAPERRVFYVDVGNMPSHLAMSFVERVKNEIHQRRIPSQTGGGTSIMDATYNPISMNEDFFFPQTADGRGSKVETLPGGENLGQIDDLKYFNNKLMRGLRVPSSYLPTGPDDSERVASDGRVGTALIQENRFNQYCLRLQMTISQKLDDEFKMFLRWRGFNIDSGLFQLKLTEPQNFASYREAELDTSRIASFMQLEQTPYLSKRFMLARYLGLTEDEIVKNSKMWKEENDHPEATAPTGQGLRSVGLSPAGLESDIEIGSDAGMPEMDQEGMPPNEAPSSSTLPPIPGQPPATTAQPA
jgi:hypothetical protein